MSKKIWILDIERELTPNLIMGATKCDGDIAVISVYQNHDELAGLPVKEIYEISPNGVIIEDYLATIKNIVEQSGTSNVVFTPNSLSGKTLGVALSESLDAPYCSEVQDLELDGDAVVCSRMTYGGLAVAKESLTGKNIIVGVKDYTFAVTTTSEGLTPVLNKVDLINEGHNIKCLEKLPKEKKEINLKQAKHIIAVGRGLKQETDLAMVEELAKALDAELGCSRPISETEKWMPHERYIGISSVSAKPDVYVAIGISGQIQHMVAIKDAGKIIAINTDKEAPIFSYADYGIVGDLYKVVPKLLESLK